MNDFDNELLERYLKLFGFDLDQNPSKIEIKSAYRKLMAKNHPDKVNKLDKEIQDIAEKRTQELNEAFKYIEKNYTPLSMSEILKKLNEENLELKQKLNDLKLDLEKIENISNDEENQIGFWDKPWLTRKEMLLRVIFVGIVWFFIFWFGQ